MKRAGEIIRAVRKMRRIKKSTFARQIGTSVATLYRLEEDDPRVDLALVAKAAQELGLPFDWKSRKVEPPANLPVIPERRRRQIVVSAEAYDGLVERARAAGFDEDVVAWLESYGARAGRSATVRGESAPPAAARASGAKRDRQRRPTPAQP